MSFSLVLMVRSCRNMKICLRYPPPKSSSSGGGLAIASLQVFVCLFFYLSFYVSGTCKVLSSYVVDCQCFEW